MLDNIGQVLPMAASRCGDQTALVGNGRAFTFRQLDLLSARLARSLHTLGVAAGDRVALYAPNGWEWIVSHYAIARAGAVINPVNALLTADEVRYVIDNCGASVLLASWDKAVPLIEQRSAGLGEVIVFGDGAAAGGARSFNAVAGC